ncbi:hypothetical protein NECAME_07080 [Necator americanus]|uniref:CHK kinase-like domain-containing protein n=1 Tax=Necator americanus TaxID=51031 RepID=W2TQG7_NECAM|nr:hypothetical protein NECAME_07080 [Necator americanus]ETN84053.1 hypothetical protein NECAME_07080 [Necator americanus]
MEKVEVLSNEERIRVEALLRICFWDVENFDKNVTYKFVVLSDNRSFWSKIIRVLLSWKTAELARLHPKSLFMKIPRVSDNVKNIETKMYDKDQENKDAEVLVTLTKYELSWYQCYGNDKIPYFPMPKFYGAEDVTEPGTGILALEDLKLFKGKMAAMKGCFSVDAAISAHYSFEELGLPPVLVHCDMNPTNLLWDVDFKELVAVIDFQLLHTGNFAEDIVRILLLTMPRQQRQKHTNMLLKRYHDTISALFNGNPPYTLQKVHEAYDRIFMYACNFAIFAMGTYYNMYNNIEKDGIKRNQIQEEIIDRAYGTVIEAERLMNSRKSGGVNGRKVLMSHNISS